MMRYRFLVQGSAPDPYELTFERNGANLTAHCSCAAGLVGQYCKHRFAILSGNTTDVVDGAENVPAAAALLTGTDVELALKELEAAEALAERAKKEVAAAKKKLARTMSD